MASSTDVYKAKLKSANDSLLQETRKNKFLFDEKMELEQEKKNLVSQLQNLQKLNEKAKLDLKEANSRIVGLKKENERLENDKNSLNEARSVLQSKYDEIDRLQTLSMDLKNKLEITEQKLANSSNFNF